MVEDKDAAMLQTLFYKRRDTKYASNAEADLFDSALHGLRARLAAAERLTAECDEPWCDCLCHHPPTEETHNG
jgi:hypothetical protein